MSYPRQASTVTLAWPMAVCRLSCRASRPRASQRYSMLAIAGYGITTVCSSTVLRSMCSASVPIGRLPAVHCTRPANKAAAAVRDRPRNNVRAFALTKVARSAYTTLDSVALRLLPSTERDMIVSASSKHEHIHSGLPRRTHTYCHTVHHTQHTYTDSRHPYIAIQQTTAHMRYDTTTHWPYNTITHTTTAAGRLNPSVSVARRISAARTA